MSWMTLAGNAPFVIALLVMFGLAIVELIALVTGFSLNDIVDEYVISHSGIETVGDAATGMEATGSADAQGVVARFLAWLYVGKVPVLMMLIVFLTVFGLFGLIGQGIVRSFTGGYAVPAILAAPAVVVLCLPLVRWFTGGLARILPRDETSAVSAETFVGHTARITGGEARAGLPAQARITDRFGTDHYVLVEPDSADERFLTGDIVLLVRRSAGGRFVAIANPNQALVDEPPP